MPAVEFKQVDIVFGDHPEKAFPLLDRGDSREQIQQSTGQILGVANASLSVESGEICVLMGLSGSGKSTLLRAVNGLNPVSRGEVLVEHQGATIDIAQCQARTLRELRTQRIAMVFQQFALLPWRTVRENVGLGLELQGIHKKQRDAIVMDKLALVGLTQWAEQYTHELSGGMQQRVGLARAFATDADILLMDEPFSALDPLIRDKLQDELLDLQRKLKKTIIFVSHDLDEAMKIGNRIAIMEGGRVIQYDEPQRIVLQPANDYVAEFVAHMNPVNVLRASALLTPLTALVRDGEAYVLAPDLKLLMNEAAEPQVYLQDEIIPLCTQLDDERQGVLYCVDYETRMRDLMAINHHSALPVLVRDEQGQVCGVVRERELLSGILRTGVK